MGIKENGTVFGPGDVVILRGLRENPQQANSALIGPRVGQVVRFLEGGRVVVRLHLRGPFRRSTHFAKLPRVCELANVDRLATDRERVLGEADPSTTGARAVAA